MSQNYTFPKSFKFGVATAAYQIEGGWNDGGRTESIWDYSTHTFPHKITDGSNGDDACLSYYKIDEDVEMIKQLKVDFYRFSISWTRLLPLGFAHEVNPEGARYYNELIDKLIANNIEPVVTIYHWDLPQKFQELGGWTNVVVTDYFADFARVCFQLFGDRVKWWITINEPSLICQCSYGSGITAPFYTSEIYATYLASHNVLLAHAKAYHVYKDEFKELQQGRIGITIELGWYEPKTPEDEETSKNIMDMYVGLYVHPIFSKIGDYHPKLRERVDRCSKEERFAKSKLPKFSKAEVDFIKGTSDFLGLNHYIAVEVTDGESNGPTFTKDMRANSSFNPNWETSTRAGFVVCPWAIRKLLNYLKDNYDNPEVFITENGYCGTINERVDDFARINYHNVYLEEVLNAIKEDGCNVIAYTAWSLMDNYEWFDGYTYRFGLYYVDFEDPERKRIPKKSAFSYQNIIVTRKIDHTLKPDRFLH